MNKFPLYDSLCKDLPTRKMTASQKKSFMGKVKKIDQSGHDSLYALLKMYKIVNDDTSFDIPLSLEFDMNKLPNKLNHVLYKFINIHLVKMKEEDNLHNTPIKRV